MKHLLILFIALFSVSLFSQTTEPILRINTEMHSVPLRRIDSDSMGKYILTSSDDKTARLWEAETGQLIQTFRPSIDDGHEGKLYSCALSPDAEYAAMAGWTGPRGNKYIYIFQASTGRLIKRIQGLENVINDLEYSEDGKYLAASLGGSNGVRIFETSNYNTIKRLEGYGASSYNVSFSPKGLFATVSYDGYIRLYDINFNLINKITASGGDKPVDLAFSPNGDLLAVGFIYSSRVQIFSSNSLALKYETDTTGMKNDNNTDRVTWSPDGEYLYAGGTFSKYIEGNWWKMIRRWDNKGQGGYIDFKGVDDSVIDLKTMANGNLIVAGTQPDWAKLSGSGEHIFYKRGEILNYGSTDRSHLKVSWDAKEICFSPVDEEQYRFSLSDLQLTKGESTGSSYTETGPGVSVSDWKNSYSPKLNGENLVFLGNYERSRSVSVSHSGKNIVFGADWRIYNQSDKGKTLWDNPVPGVAWAVNCSEDEKTVVAAIGDGTIRWYNLMDGKELLSLFVHADKKRWVLWSPSGYYACSPGGQDLIGWHLNNGIDHEADFFSASRFESRFYRPDVVSLVLETHNEEKALAQANSARNIRVTNNDIKDILPPVITILTPNEGYKSLSEKIDIQLSIRTPNNDPVKEIRTMLNGRPVETSRGLAIVSKEGADRTITLTLKPGENYISLMAKNSTSWSDPSSISVSYLKEEKEFVIKPKLYVLAIGVSDYKNSELTLKYAAKDAQDFAAVIEAQKGKLYRDVEVKLLINTEATQDNVFDGLDWIKAQTTDKDVAMIFVAGHGINDNTGRLYYLTYEADLDSLRRTSIAADEFSLTIQAISGKVLYFMDTCHSGGIKIASRRGAGDIDMTGLINELSSAESGAVVFASSSGKQYSLEDSSWGNGAFTKALVEGLRGKADYLGNGKITINMLDLYISERVKELTNGQQTPTTAKPDTIPDYPIAVK